MKEFKSLGIIQVNVGDEIDFQGNNKYVIITTEQNQEIPWFNSHEIYQIIEWLQTKIVE